MDLAIEPLTQGQPLWLPLTILQEVETEMKDLLLVLLSVGVMALLAVTVFAAGFDHEDDDKLVLWLDFDALDIEDLSPKKTPFQSIEGEPKIVEGLVGNAWHFVEQVTRITIEEQTFNDAFEESTFSVWVKESSESGVVYEEGGGTNGHCIQMLNGELQFCTRDGGAATCIQADFPTDDDDWHLIITIFNEDVMEIYIDGEKVADTDGVPGIAGHGNEMGIGNVDAVHNGTACTQNAGQWTGIMDEFAITRRIATAQEIKEEFESGGILSVEAAGKMAVTWGNMKITYR